MRTEFHSEGWGVLLQQLFCWVEDFAEGRDSQIPPKLYRAALNYNISNFFGMEADPKALSFSDDERSLIGGEALRPLPLLNQFEEFGMHSDEGNVEVNIQSKYYNEFKKIYLTSFKLWTELRKQAKSKESLSGRVSAIESQLTALHKARRYEEEAEALEEGENDSKRRASKRQRRTAEEIERKYNCEAEYCGRCYGSEGSLQQHIKLKHPEMYKKEESLEEC